MGLGKLTFHPLKVLLARWTRHTSISSTCVHTDLDPDKRSVRSHLVCRCYTPQDVSAAARVQNGTVELVPDCPYTR